MTEKSPIREYRSAGGVVVRRAGNQVLVLKRPKRLDQNGRPEMRLPKGHIEPGEKPKEAALREVCEETGLRALEILSDLGHQIVEFEWKGHHYVRDESCFLMTIPPEAPTYSPERQFERKWLSWEQALALLTFVAEREWVSRARSAWQTLNARRYGPESADRETPS